MSPAVRFGVATEEALHRACVQLLRLYEARGLLTFTHPANGACKSPATAGLMKALGQQAGVSALLVWTAERHFQVELKTQRSASPRNRQPGEAA